MAARSLLALLLAAGPGLAQTVLEPRLAVLRPGQELDFTVRGAYGGPGPLRWSIQADDGGPTGTLDPFRGHYTAPATDTVRTVRITATRGDSSGSAKVTLLPGQPFGLLDRVLGPGWLEPFAMDLPFWDLEAGRRFPAPGRVRYVRSEPVQVLAAGYGLPCRLALPEADRATAQLLSYRDGDDLVRRDVTGRAETTLSPVGLVWEGQVEALVPVPGGDREWWSVLEPLQVWVRGLLPLAGSPLAPGHQDGAGGGARFREPWGLAGLGESPGFWRLAVADTADHTVRVVDHRGRVATLCGTPGQAGHRDAVRTACACGSCRSRRPSGAQLRGPTHLTAVAVPRGRFQGQDLLLADSGNHVIRGLTGEGETLTLAGCAGLAGHRDAVDALEALFDDPRGLDQDFMGNVYVADRGNRVIRRINPSGQVTTLAGSPGQSGTRDGRGPEARFRDLKALVCAPGFPPGRPLLVLDGHAVRAVDPATGTVRTILGQVDTPGFADPDGPERLDQPCLRDPADLAWAPDFLYVADHGNHAVRRLDPISGRLITLAGDPAGPETRWGLLRDGMPVPPAAAHAALAGPRGLAPMRCRLGHALAVATGPCLGLLCEGPNRREAWDLELDGPGQAGRNGPVVVRVRALPAPDTPAGPDPGRVTVAFREADGSAGVEVRMAAPAGTWVPVTGTFTQAGTAEVVARFASADGICAGAQCRVTVR